MPGTKCWTCEEEPQYHEKGKVNSYCGITCAAETGAMGEPKQNAKLPNNAMIQEEDTKWMGSNYMATTSISHVEMLEQDRNLGFVACTVFATERVPVYSKGLSDLLPCQNMGFIASD